MTALYLVPKTKLGGSGRPFNVHLCMRFLAGNTIGIHTFFIIK